MDMRKAFVIVVLVLAAAITACVPTPEKLEVTVLVTQPPLATYTPLPTYTSLPTYTPLPPVPTYTALPPVLTSTSMPTSMPAATATPTSAPTNVVKCSRPVGDRFSGIWSAIQKRPTGSAMLGCPLNDPHVVRGAAEEFQNGYMLWRNDNKQILVLYTNGHASTYADTFQAGTDPEKAGYAAPAGFVEPRSGFGKVWREQLGGPSSEIGWAKGDEYVTKNLMAQDFDNGVIFWEDFVGNRVFFVSPGSWEQW